jgi:hypothetical protein
MRIIIVIRSIVSCYTTVTTKDKKKREQNSFALLQCWKRFRRPRAGIPNKLLNKSFIIDLKHNYTIFFIITCYYPIYTFYVYFYWLLPVFKYLIFLSSEKLKKRS